jgi:DNA-binding Xre family transcriptional regulator
MEQRLYAPGADRNLSCVTPGKERKLSHRRIVTDFGFHLGQLAKIESGGAVSAQTLLKLCAAFDMTLEELVRGLAQREPN